jgi:hypothetical protein
MRACGSTALVETVCADSRDPNVSTFKQLPAALAEGLPRSSETVRHGAPEASSVLQQLAPSVQRTP